jgi:putative sigma-54 modulation protein
MKINITGKNIQITEPLREFTIAKFDKLLKHYSSITSIQVIFDVVKLVQVAEATLHIPNHQIHAKAEAEKMYAAIDLLIDKLNAQLIKHKQKDSQH